MRPVNISGQHPSLPWPLQAPWDLLDHVTQVTEQLAQQPVEGSSRYSAHSVNGPE